MLSLLRSWSIFFSASPLLLACHGAKPNWPREPYGALYSYLHQILILNRIDHRPPPKAKKLGF